MSDPFNQNECPICTDKFVGLNNRVTTECGHTFHCSCLMKHVARNGFGCPYCRATMAENPNCRAAIAMAEIPDDPDDPDDYFDHTSDINLDNYLNDFGVYNFGNFVQEEEEEEERGVLSPVEEEEEEEVEEEGLWNLPIVEEKRLVKDISRNEVHSYKFGLIQSI